MTDQWDEKAREIFAGMFNLQGRPEEIADLAAALRAAYDQGVEDSAEAIDGGHGSFGRTYTVRIRALKRGGK